MKSSRIGAFSFVNVNRISVCTINIPHFVFFSPLYPTPAATAGQTSAPPHPPPPPPTPSQPDVPAGGLSPPADQLSPPAAASVVMPCPSTLRSAVSAEDEPTLSTAVSAATSKEPVTLITDEICDDELYGNQAAQAQIRPEFVPVQCVATYENCPDSQLNQDYVDSLMRYLNSEPHLQQNIERADLKHLSSRSFRNGVFVHTVDVTMQVRTARLWESPASYVRKFLGLTNMWKGPMGQ